MDKKAASLGLGIILPLIVILMMAGIYLGASLYVQEEFKGEMPLDTKSAYNETHNNCSDVARAFTYPYCISTSAVVTNATGGELVPSTNYTITCTEKNSTITMDGGSLYNNTALNVTYKYFIDTIGYYAINDTQNAIGKVSSMMTLVAVISVIVIILTLLTIGLGGVSRVS